MMTTNDNSTKKLIKVLMSERAPVKIDPEDWAIIAEAADYSGPHESQANHKWFIKVREHEDGRRLVYGQLVRGPGGAPAGWKSAYAGFVIDPKKDDVSNETVRAIRRVAGLIGNHDLGSECVADLPVETL